MRQKPPPREDARQPTGRDRAAPYAGPPPTLADSRQHRVTGLLVQCLGEGCMNSRRFAYEELPFDEATTTYPDLRRLRRFVCTRCGGRDVSIMADWPADRHISPHLRR